MYFFVAKLFSIAPSRSKPSDEPADLLRTQRINFSYAKMHATAARALSRFDCDTTTTYRAPAFIRRDSTRAKK